MIYFAIPYSDDDKNIRQHRFEIARTITAQIINEQNYIIPFSPVVYTHDLSQYVGSEHDWYEWDLQFLARCDAMVVIQLEGWEVSYGVQKEIKFCEENGLPILYVAIDEIDTFIKHSNFRGFLDAFDAEEKTLYEHPDGTQSMLLTDIKP